MAKIVQTQEILGGKPRIEGTRIPVGIVVSYFLQGYTYHDIKRDYPHLTDDQIDAARDYVLKHPQKFNLEPEKA
ncbi:DUF433 domain-containing protein [Candidatus Berkelbacteria bacterium]|nr:DUF433 domain-containing protein [Candidatus Berkelbacteria bacterium]